MHDVDFDQYSQQSVHFFSRRIPKLLERWLGSTSPDSSYIDVGCGDGQLVWALKETGHLSPTNRVYGVDISPIRLQRFESLTGFTGVRAEDHRIPDISTGSIDMALSTMVIEHIPDDAGHVLEMARIVRPGGMLYLSTVIRKRGAWYFRKAPDGRRVLDPTHLREYPNVAGVIQLVEAGGFVIREQRLARLVFPVAHPLVRWFHARWPIKNVQRLFLTDFARWLEVIAIPIPRYRSIEIIAERAADMPDATGTRLPH